MTGMLSKALELNGRGGLWMQEGVDWSKSDPSLMLFLCLLCFHGAERRGTFGFFGPAPSAAILLVAVGSTVLAFALYSLTGIVLVFRI